MRLAFGLIQSVAWLLLPLGAARGASALTNEWKLNVHSGSDSAPAVGADGTIYFGSWDKSLYALDADGKKRWQFPTAGQIVSSPVIGPDGTICVGVLQHLWAISADGRKKWGRVGGDDYPFETSPVVLASGSIACVSSLGELWYASPKGVHQWMYYLYGYGYGSPAGGPTGAIYVPDWGDNFNALRAGVALACTPWPKFRGNARNTGNVQDGTP